jgi:hypothetical protein
MLAVATAGAAPAARAQQGSCPLPPGAAAAPPIAVGSIRRGTLQRDSERQPFRLSLSGTAAAQVDLESDSFDPRLIVCERKGGGWRQIADDDDGGNGLNARVLLSGTGNREYLLIAASVAGSGQFDLLVRDRPPPPPPPVKRITVGTGVSGKLDGRPADYEFEARAGGVYQIDLVSNDFDALVEVRRADDAANPQPLAQDDDGGEGTNARLTFVAPKAGAYRVRARSFGRGSGAYRLLITEARIETLGPGTHDKRLPETGSATFQFEAAANTAYLIEMRSRDLDSLIEVRPLAGDGPVLRDDDGGEGNDSRLLYFPRQPGPQLITARALGGGSGPYQLVITPYRRAE